ncbi:MAG: DUF6384 family protein [Devosia sp.]
MSATDDKGAAGDAAPLTEQMLTMDIVDTLSRSPDLAASATAARQLEALYAQLSIPVSGPQIADGIAAFETQRFAYASPGRGFGVALARLYVLRRHWLPPAVAIALMFVIGFGGYFLVYKPYRDAQLAQLQHELAVDIPSQMDGLYQAIFEETKVQQAVSAAQGLLADGKDAAARGDRGGVEAALAGLTQIRDTLQQAYRIMVVDRPTMKWGFWTFPENNTDATNYYLVVEARDAQGRVVNLPVTDEATRRTETVSTWALRVPEGIYRAVAADRVANGAIKHPLVGVKDYGFLEPDFTIDVLGGTLTRW